MGQGARLGPALSMNPKSHQLQPEGLMWGWAVAVWMALLKCIGRAVLTGGYATVELFTALRSDAIGVALVQAGCDLIETFVRGRDTGDAAYLIAGIDTIIAVRRRRRGDRRQHGQNEGDFPGLHLISGF